MFTFTKDFRHVNYIIGNDSSNKQKLKVYEQWFRVEK